MSDLRELLERVERADGEPDEATLRDVCQALMFGGTGHGCGATCTAIVRFREAGKAAVLDSLRSLIAERSP